MVTVTKQSTNQVGLLTGSRDGADDFDDMLTSQRKKRGGHCSDVSLLCGSWLTSLHIQMPPHIHIHPLT